MKRVAVKIEKLYCFISNDGTDEGIVGFMTPEGMMMPMVGADMERVYSLMPIAQKIANATSKNITLCEFDNRSEVKVIEPILD
jgi:hypothetical protein